jgi:poly(hydroxyalkanoate) depolymerase family esterase
MFSLNAGATHPANNDARAKRLEAATDLVNRTLAQHGLLPGNTNLADRMDGLMGNFGRSPKGAADLPPGASFENGSFTCPHGTRQYRTYLPSTATDGVNGLILMLHGCTQTPEDFAIGTGMNALAELHRLIIVYPFQSRGENAQSCWNWFRRGDQMRDRGEPAILAELARQEMEKFGVPARRCYAAGLSAGAAMAVILGHAYGDVFAAVGAHSGLPLGAATDVPSAFAAMAGQSVQSPRKGSTRSVPTIAFHGSADSTVHPSNSQGIIQQAAPPSDAKIVETVDSRTTGTRQVRITTTATALGAPVSEHWEISGLGHAWSGGQAGGSYTDPAGPDASAEMIRFFLETTAGDI